MPLPAEDEFASLSAAPSTLRGRRPGHAVMSRCLELVEQHGLIPTPAGAVLPEPARSWSVGAHGERDVGMELLLLPQEWAVLHSVPVGASGTDIDHLVIGPGGVFVLNTKAHRNARIRVGEFVVWVAGHQVNGYQRAIARRAEHVTRALEPVLGARAAAVPLLVFVGAAGLETVGTQHVASCTAADLVAVLTAAPAVLPQHVVTALVARAERPETWDAPASAAHEQDPTDRFLALPTTTTAPVAPTPARIPARIPARRATSAQAPHLTALRTPRPALLGQMARSLLVLAAGYTGLTVLIGLLTQLLHR